MTDKQPKSPTHIIWQVIDGKTKDDARWIRVGAAWTNKDGKGFSLAFDSYPVIGRIQLREALPQRQAEAGGAQ